MSVELRQRIASDRRAARVERAFDIPLLAAALLVIPFLVIDESRHGHTLGELAAVLNWTIWVTFAAEMAAMLLVSPRPLQWLRRNPLEVAIVLLTPPLLPSGLAALRLVRLLRVFRLALVVKQTQRLFSPNGIKFAALIAGAAALVGAAIFADVERHYSLWDGLWWSVNTMATNSGGRVAPQTVTGRIIGMALLPIGIGFFALLTGAIAHRFLGPTQQPEQEPAGDGSERQQLHRQLRRLEERLDLIEEALRRDDDKTALSLQSPVRRRRERLRHG